MINKWYYKTIVLNIGPRLRPPGSPAHARPVRPVGDHPLGPSRSRPLGFKVQHANHYTMEPI